MKKEITKKLREVLLEKGIELDNDLVSKEKQQEEKEKDIVKRSEDKSILPNEENN
jgi:hypothetical protein